MTVEPGWVPPGIDTTKANVARVYDCWLGGDHNFRADRDAGPHDDRARAERQGHRLRANRAFLGRAVRFLAGEAGIRQFLDIGSGIPTENNVHQVAQDAAPGARVVYVDDDDVAVAHSRLMLDGNADAAVIQADVRDPARILVRPGNPAAARLQPAGRRAPGGGAALPPRRRTSRGASSPPCAMRSLPAATSSSATPAETSSPAWRPRSRPSTRAAWPPTWSPHPRGDRQTVRRFHPPGPRPGLDTPMAARVPGRRSRGPVEVLGLVGVARYDGRRPPPDRFGAPLPFGTMNFFARMNCGSSRQGLVERIAQVCS